MAKQPGTSKTPTTTTPATDAGAPVTSLFCTAEACKSKGSRFSFCDEHYEQFKFGLIKKDGKPASDYYKKLEHYQAYLARHKSVRKVA